MAAVQITGGTNIGDMTGGDGLAGAFDGNTSTAAESNDNNVYIGKTLATKRRFSHAILKGKASEGFSNNNGASVTVTMRGKQGSAPSGRTDGTSIGSSTFTDPDDASSVQINSADTNTVWDHIWADISTSGRSRVSELELWGYLPATAVVVAIG